MAQVIVLYKRHPIAYRVREIAELCNIYSHVHNLLKNTLKIKKTTY